MHRFLRIAAVGIVAALGVGSGSTAAGATEVDHPVSWVESAPIIRLGDRGPSVTEWQLSLNEWVSAAALDGVSRLAADGEFGPLTDGLTRRFQIAQSIPVDGVVGPVTRAAFLSAPALASAEPDPAADAPVFGSGDVGPAVSDWQAQLNRWLRAAGSDETALVVDGVFGVRTGVVTRIFQARQRITVDGLVGPETMAAMISAPSLVNLSMPAPPESSVPAAGICGEAVGPTAVFMIRKDAATPRRLRVKASQRLELVNALGTSTAAEIGVLSLEVPANRSVTLDQDFGGLIQPGVHTVHISTFSGAGPQVWFVD